MQKFFVLLTKIVLLLVLIWIVSFLVIAFSTELHIETGLSEYSVIAFHEKLYTNIRNFVVGSQENKKTILNISNTFNLIDSEKNTFFQKVDNFSHDKDLYDTIFFYVVSGDIPSLTSIIDTYWKNEPNFQEAYVVGETGDLLYKYGSYSLMPQKLSLSSKYWFQTNNDMIDLIINWQDETFEKELQFHLLFQKKQFQSWISTYSIPIALQLGNVLLTTPKTPSVSLEELGGKDKFHRFTIYSFPLEWRQEVVGEVYFFVPNQTIAWFIGVVFRFLLVVGITLALVGIFFWIDKQVNHLNNRNKKHSREEEINEQNIRWVEEFLAQQREDKK